MSKFNFSFIRNKFFFYGLFTGVLITAVAFLLIFSSLYPPPVKNKLSGTMGNEPYVPAVGEAGVVVSSGNDCNYIYCDVTFDNDPNHTVVHCHCQAYCSPSVEVEVYASNSQEFCQGGGVSVGIIPGQN